MWDDSSPSVSGESVALATGDPAPPWTDGQLIRIENEWRRAQRSFAYHPSIGIAPLRGDPPYEYQLEYRVRSLVLNEANALQYVDSVSMHVWLPPGFPNQPPVVRPLVAVFHPNIAWEGVYLTNLWRSDETLVDLVARVGELLAFRSYDPESVVNTMAMDWLAQNSGTLPLDARADFSGGAGGEPLGRIMRMGPATLEQIRRALDDMRFALLAASGTPTITEIESFARATRSALSLFLEGDVPESMREQASEYDDWCRELPASAPTWQYLRQLKDAIAASESGLGGLRPAADALESQIKALSTLATMPPGDSTASAVSAIPPRAVLEPLRLGLPPIVRDFERRIAAIHSALDTMKLPPPRTSVAPDGSLGRRLVARVETLQNESAAASQGAQAALTEFEPLLRRAKVDSIALEKVAGWRDYFDLLAEARAIEGRIAAWGSAGIQAFFIDNASGSYGPFQLEEPIDLGGQHVVVRCGRGTHIEAINPHGLDLLGQSADGTLKLVAGKSSTEGGHATTLRLSGRCDDLAVQIDFIMRQTGEALGDLLRPVQESATWCGRICGVLASPQALSALRDAHRKSAHRWKALILDLGALSRFKERLASHNLLHRLAEESARIVGLIRDARKQHEQASQKIGAIMSRCGRDVETDRLIIPPKYLEAYNQELRGRDKARKETERLEASLKGIAAELTERLSDPRRCGRPEIPVFRALAPLPQPIADLSPVMADAEMAKSLAELSKLVATPLAFKPPPVAGELPPSRPASPTRAPAKPAKPSAPAALRLPPVPQPHAESLAVTDEDVVDE